MNGVLIIDKPEGYTSHDVVACLRGILKTKKIGHTGTLDPFATGVLVMLIGKATRLAKFLDKDEKAYEAILKFGFETDSGDRTGEQQGNANEKRIALEDIEKALPNFKGDILQTPPMHSAKKIKGKKLYELARKGIEVERKSVSISIKELRVLTSHLLEEKQEASIFVRCSAGTYIRTLAEDIGRNIGVGCHLAELRRIAAGKFDISQAVTLKQLEEKTASDQVGDVLISMNEALTHLEEIILSDEEITKVRNGGKIHGFDKIEAGADDPIRLTDRSGNLIAIGYSDLEEKVISPRIVMI